MNSRWLEFERATVLNRFGRPRHGRQGQDHQRQRKDVRQYGGGRRVFSERPCDQGTTGEAHDRCDGRREGRAPLVVRIGMQFTEHRNRRRRAGAHPEALQHTTRHQDPHVGCEEAGEEPQSHHAQRRHQNPLPAHRIGEPTDQKDGNDDAHGVEPVHDREQGGGESPLGLVDGEQRKRRIGAKHDGREGGGNAPKGPLSRLGSKCG